MAAEKTANATYWCRFIHVRHATLLLAVAYLCIHLLGLYLLVHLSVNLESINNAKLQVKPIMKELVIVENVDVVPATGQDEEPPKPIAKFTTINWWINVFIINDPRGAKLNRYDLNMGMMLECFNTLVSFFAILGVVKRWPGCLVPFLLNQVFDIIFSILLVCGVEVGGLGAQPNLLTAGVIGSPIANALAASGSQISIVLGVSKVLFKLCLIRIILMCIQHLRDLNNSIFRDERHEQWATRLLEGHIAVDSPFPPPAYEASDSRTTEIDFGDTPPPRTFVAKKVTDI